MTTLDLATDHGSRDAEKNASAKAASPAHREAWPARGFRRFSLATKFALFSAAIGAVVMTLLTLYMYNGAKDALIDAELHALSESANDAVYRFNGEIDLARRDVLFQSQTPPIAGIARAWANNGIDPIDGSSEELWKERMAALFSAMLEARPEYMQIRFIGLEEDGREVVRVDSSNGEARRTPDAELQSKGDRPYFVETVQLAKGEVFLSEIDLNQEFGQVEVPHRPVIRAATPAFDSSGNLIGVVVINVDITYLFGLVAEADTDTQNVYVTNMAGDYLYHPDEAQTFGFDLGERHLIQDEWPELAWVVTANVDTRQQLLDLSSVPYLVSVRRIAFDRDNPEHYLVLVQTRAESEVAGDIAALRNSTALVVAALLLASVLAVLWLVRFFVGPLKQMTDAAAGIAAGDRHFDLGTLTDRRDESGELARAFDRMVHDLTLREDQLLRKTEEQASFVTLVQNAGEAIILVDQQHQITMFNRGAEQVFGYSADEITGQLLNRLLPKRFRKSHDSFVGDFANKGATSRNMGESGTVFGLRKDGSEFAAEASITQLRVGGEKVFGAILRDVSERESILAQLKEQTNELARSNGELSQFAYIASHDLQEPLRMVASYLGLLESRYAEQLDQDAREFIDYAVDGAERMKALINDLLSYSRVSNRALNYAHVETDALVARILDTYAAAKISEAGATVTIGQLPAIRADEGQFERLMANLIDNALKYRSDAPPEIGITAKKDGRFWRFSVSDNGIGIDEKYRGKVFEIFARLHDRGKYSGTGIGLAACKRIVERHGGTIWVEAASGGGSVFHFTLPRR